MEQVERRLRLTSELAMPSILIVAAIGLFLSEEVRSRDVAEIGLFSMKDNLQLGCGRDRSIPR